jgi:hypothetical protein
MGGIHSRSIRDSKVLPKSTPRELINEFLLFLELGHKAYFDFYRTQLSVFTERLIARTLDIEAYKETIAYYKKLIGTQADLGLFDTALHISNLSDQIWLLNDRTLNFFAELNKKSNKDFMELMTQLYGLCKEKRLDLKANHLDTVIAAIEQQKTLAANALTFIDPFLKKTPINYKSALSSLRLLHRPELDRAAKEHLKLHHAIPHSLEIRERSLLVFNQLELFSEDDAADIFLKDLISFMIEFHDHEQVDKGSFMSMEEITADRVIYWLHLALSLDIRPELRTLLDYIANRIIVLGTTMIFSPTHTADLSELYLLIGDYAEQAGIVTVDPSNRQLSALMDCVMLITGVCDKNPVALPWVVDNQANFSELCTFNLLKAYNKGMLFERFFNAGSFTCYFKEPGSLTARDYQAFFMTLTPHLAMRTELSAKKQPELARILISFVAECRHQRLIESEVDFIAWYCNQFAVLAMIWVRMSGTKLRKNKSYSSIIYS